MTDTPEFEIRHDVPLPRSKYPLSKMEVGDSFVVPLNGDTPKRVRSKLSSAAGQYKNRHGSRFTVRAVEGGVAVWRVA
jgi:hypothetical protein